MDWTKSNMIDLNLTISIFTLNLNSVNTPRRQGLDKKGPNNKLPERNVF